LHTSALFEVSVSDLPEQSEAEYSYDEDGGWVYIHNLDEIIGDYGLTDDEGQDDMLPD
jgi:hypothetical protein